MPHAILHHDPRTLHERILSTALMLVETCQTRPPCRNQVARILGEPVERIHRVFPDDRALLVAGVEQALVLLMDGCTRAVVRVSPDDPVAQFIALGDAYLDWAAANPTQFRLVSDCQIVNAAEVPRLRRYLESLDELMVRMLTRARDDGRLHPQEDIPLLVLSSRCFAAGSARMMVEGRMPGKSDAHSLDLAKLLIRDFVRRIARSSQGNGKPRGNPEAV
ncbi:WHG domain-containing protein [Paracoccus aestuarii]|uniref:WHG domain-containing protein n=1 Tax=Paracoccus aestuarii TaxID=453842 RepID=A0A418ZZZ6_9RHOB|nr:WHG domain-containing protein [Paracoccus aestuarii]RJL06102.1 WHG domain-containing protein [Paracoccus aestuarii]WCQ98062.1 WHG domain-containing protein [Paracoccus aestuarii]